MAFGKESKGKRQWPAGKLMYIPKDYPICRLKLLVGTFEHPTKLNKQ